MHIKASNGRKKVVISRSEWLAIGKKAGWTRFRRRRRGPGPEESGRQELEPGEVVSVDGRPVDVKEHIGHGVYVGHDVGTGKRVVFEESAG